MAGPDCVGIATYNLDGLNNGHSGLLDLCNKSQIHIIAVQEHWLSNSNLHLLNNIHPDFVGFGISSMTEKLNSEVYRGRPYGGVGFLWRKGYSPRINICVKAVSRRCLSVVLELDSRERINIITAYFPCYRSGINYNTELTECLGFIKEVPDDGLQSVILGDMNFPCDTSNAGYKLCYNVLSRYDMYHCDEFISSKNCFTYCNYSLNQFSFVDHVFVSDSIRQDIISAKIHDTGVNLSDHIPVVYTFKWALSSQNCKSSKSAVKQYSWRWDKSDLSYYYYLSDLALRNISVPVICDCALGCHNACHLDAVNIYYENTVAALHHAACNAIQRVPCHALKPYTGMRNLIGLKMTHSFGTVSGLMLEDHPLVHCSASDLHVGQNTNLQ